LLSSPLCITLFSSSHCWAFLFALLRSPLCTILNFSSRCWVLLFVLFYFPPRNVGLSFVMLLYFLLDVARLSFVLLNFPLWCYFPFCVVWPSSLCCSPLRLLSYFKYKVLSVIVFIFVVLLLVCCYSLKNLVLPPYIPSCRNWEWLSVENWKPIFFQ